MRLWYPSLRPNSLRDFSYATEHILTCLLGVSISLQVVQCTSPPTALLCTYLLIFYWPFLLSENEHEWNYLLVFLENKVGVCLSSHVRESFWMICILSIPRNGFNLYIFLAQSMPGNLDLSGTLAAETNSLLLSIFLWLIVIFLQALSTTTQSSRHWHLATTACISSLTYF